MVTAEDGGATANTTSSSYCGGGAGGKFRKKPLRRQTTPYDRPSTAPRGNNANNDDQSSWMTKLFVEPAYKLISSGADRLFASVFRRRLPPPPPPHSRELDAEVCDADQGAGLDGQDGAHALKPEVGDCRQPENNPGGNVVVELEKLLKQKTFTRHEIVHLTELLQSRVVEGSLADVGQKNEDNVSEFGMRQEFVSGPLKGNRDWGIKSSAVVTTPVQHSKVLEDDIASPAELAVAYMGSRPSKISPSHLGTRNKLLRDETGFTTNMSFASKSPSMLTNKAFMSLGTPENVIVTPRSRSRSAIYNLARTPYSRVHPASTLKGINKNSGPSTSSLSPLANNEIIVSQPLSLKRRSSVLNDDGTSLGPMRRIRQKSNLSALRLNHNAHGIGIGSDSHSKQKPQSMGDQRDKALENTLENENASFPSTSYTHVPSRSREVAAKILQQLDKVSPKDKSLESKFVAASERGSLKSTPSIRFGQAPRSREDVDSFKLLLDVQDDHDFRVRTKANPPDAHGSSPGKQVNATENNSKASAFSSGACNSSFSKDGAVTLTTSKPSIVTADFVQNGALQASQKKRAFGMGSQEDSLDQDAQCNGIASRSLSKNKGLMGSSLMDSEVGSDKLVKPTIESKDKLPLAFISKKTNEFTCGATAVGEGASAITIPTLEETRVTLQSDSFVSSFPTYDKPKEADNPPPFSFSSKLADKFPTLPAECVKRAETESRSSSSSDNVSVSIASQVKTPEPDINGKRDNVSSAASNGPLISSFSSHSFPTNHMSKSSTLLFTSSPSITNFVSTGTSNSGASSGSIFGLAASTVGNLEVGDQRTKVEIYPSSGNSTSSHIKAATFAASSSGSSIFGLGGSSTGNNLQSSPLFIVNDKSISGAGFVLQGSSSQLFSSTSAPAFNVNTLSSAPTFNVNAISSLGSSPNPTFGFNSLVSSTVPKSLAPAGGSSIFNFGSSASAVTEGFAASFTTSAPPGIFGFGPSSFSSSTTAVGSSSGGATLTFSFGGTSSAPASVINTGSSFNADTSGKYNFDGSSSASSSSSSAPSTISSSSWQSQNPFGSTFSSPLPSTTGFVFGAASTSSASNAVPPIVFNAPAVASSNTASPIVFNTSAVALSSPAFSMSNTQSIFGNSPMGGGFATSPGNNDRMNVEDCMAEDPAPSSTPAPAFGQPPVSSSPVFGSSFPTQTTSAPAPSSTPAPAFGQPPVSSSPVFGSSFPTQTTSLVFSAQQNQAAPPNSSPFQATGSAEFSAGSGFSLGSGGPDKSGRKIVKINRNRIRRR